MKRLLIALVLLLGGLGAAMFYYWQQATQLPAWYTHQASEQSDQQVTENRPASETDRSATGPASANTDRPLLAQENRPSGSRSPQPHASAPITVASSQSGSPSGQNPNSQVQLNSGKLNRLLTAEMARKADRNGLAKAVKGVNTTIQDGKIESGAVVSLAEVPVEQLPDQQRSILERLIRSFPELSHRNLYVGLEGKPTVKDGRVQLDDNAQVRLGNLSLSPAEIARRLGVSEADVRRQIELGVQLGDVKLNQGTLAGDRGGLRDRP